jgi:hypothetical protein
MKKKNKITLNLIGLSLCSSVLVAELASPDKNEYLHRGNIYISIGGIILFALFMFNLYRVTKKGTSQDN